MQNATPEQLRQQLLQLGEDLQQALKQHNWDAVAKIDQRVRICLQAMPEQPGAELMLAKQQMRQLYGRVIPAYGEACEKIRQLLLAHVEHAEGRTAYMRTDLLPLEK